MRRAHNAAHNVGYLFGPGVYGLRKHVVLNDEQMDEVRTVAEEIITESGDKQWHCYELLSEVLDRLSGDFVGLDKYALNIALFASKNVKFLRKLTWMAANGNVADQTRIEIFQGVVSIVRSAGHPLTTSEIKIALSAVRGVNETFQFAPAYPLVRLGPALWGLNERDVPLTRDRQRDLIEQLVAALKDKGTGIHEDEVAAFVDIGRCPVVAFLSIAMQDSRIKVSPAHYAYLSEWGGPKRESLTQAIVSILDTEKRAMSLDEVVAMVEARTGRPFDRRLVSRTLQALDARYDDLTRMWSRAAPEIEDEADIDDAIKGSPVAEPALSKEAV